MTDQITNLKLEILEKKLELFATLKQALAELGNEIQEINC
jgi:hypothetical protein